MLLRRGCDVCSQQGSHHTYFSDAEEANEATLGDKKLIEMTNSRPPSWISNPSFTDLANITLYKCINHDILPSIGELLSLKILVVEIKNSEGY